MSLQPNSSSRDADVGRSATAQEFVEKWRHTQSNKPGFRKGTAIVPGSEIPQLEVSSWLQLPYILQRLSSGPVKVVFPQSKSSTVTSEQATIKAFLRENHRAPLETLLPAIAAGISKSESFASLTTRHPGLISSADAWIAAHDLSTAKTLQLKTTDIISTPAAADHQRLAGFKQTAERALAEHIAAGRPLVVSVPAAANQSLVADALGKVCWSNASFAPAMKSAKVWCPKKGAIDDQLEELSIGIYLARHASTWGQFPKNPQAELARPQSHPSSVSDGSADQSLLLAAEEQGISGGADQTPSAKNPTPDDGEADLRNSRFANASGEQETKRRILEAFRISGDSKKPFTIRVETADPRREAKQIRETLEEHPGVDAKNVNVVIQLVDLRRPHSAHADLPLGRFLQKYGPPADILPEGLTPGTSVRNKEKWMAEVLSKLRSFAASKSRGPLELRTATLSLAAECMRELLEAHPALAANSVDLVIKLVDLSRPNSAPEERLLKDFLPSYSSPRGILPEGLPPVAENSSPSLDSLPEVTANDPSLSSIDGQSEPISPEPSQSLDSLAFPSYSPSSSSPAVGAGASEDSNEAQASLVPADGLSAAPGVSSLQEKTRQALARRKRFLDSELAAHADDVRSEDFSDQSRICFDRGRAVDPFGPEQCTGSKAQVVYPAVQEEFVISEGPAYQVLRECMARPLGECAQRLFQALEKLVEMRSDREDSDERSRQVRDLVILPTEGSAIFCSDLEGGVEALAMVIDQYNLIERWERGEPIFLCVLGDSIDRSDTGSLLMEFLLELKLRSGFSDRIVVLAGNHEVTPTQNWEDLGRDQFLGELFSRKFPHDPDQETYAKVSAQLQELCPEKALSLHEKVQGVDEELYRERWGLYTLFHSIFMELPRSIISLNGLYAAHAGFPRNGTFEPLFQEEPATEADIKHGGWLNELANIRYWKNSSSTARPGRKTAARDQLWSDLTTQFGAPGEFVSQDDPKRHTVTSRPKFTLDDFKRFADATGTSLMIRGHQDNPERALELRKRMLPSPIIQFIKSFGGESGNDSVDSYIRFIGGSVWTHGNIATLEHQSWCALLDLSKKMPTVGDISWIGSQHRTQPDGSMKYYLSRPPLPEYPAPAEAEERSNSDVQPPGDLNQAGTSAEAATIPLPVIGEEAGPEEEFPGQHRP